MDVDAQDGVGAGADLAPDDGRPSTSPAVGTGSQPGQEGTLGLKRGQAGPCCSLKLGKLGCPRRAPAVPKDRMVSSQIPRGNLSSPPLGILERQPPQDSLRSGATDACRQGPGCPHTCATFPCHWTSISHTPGPGLGLRVAPGSLRSGRAWRLSWLSWREGKGAQSQVQQESMGHPLSQAPSSRAALVTV